MKEHVVLYAPQSYWEASLAVRERLTNGCGTRGILDYLVPDNLLGLSILHACKVHDWMYGEGETIQDKEEADRVFLNNMLRIIEHHSSSWLKRPRILLAGVYHHFVVKYGGPAYWRDKNGVNEQHIYYQAA